MLLDQLLPEWSQFGASYQKPCTTTVVNNYEQKHLGCKKMRGQLEVACKQSGATKSFDAAKAKKLLYQKNTFNSLNDIQ